MQLHPVYRSFGQFIYSYCLHHVLSIVKKDMVFVSNRDALFVFQVQQFLHELKKISDYSGTFLQIRPIYLMMG